MVCNKKWGGGGLETSYYWNIGHIIHVCAAEAIFWCPTMNSHRLKSSVTSKEPAFHNETESRRTWPRCHVSLEKSSKNHKPLEKWAKPNLTPSVPSPRPPSQMASIFRGFSTWWYQIRQNYPPFWPAVQDGKNQGRGWGDLRFDIAH